jgi:uncharacterized RDD family membrane protein YckC
MNLQITYARLPDRIKALIIDQIVVIVFAYLATEILSLFTEVADYVRMMIFIFLFVLYDPIFISSFGATIGHSKANISVKRENNPNKNILFHLAIIRYFLKVFLGWLSLLTITGNEKRRAIHDFVAGSVVIKP